MLRLIVLGLVVAGAWFGFQKLQDLNREDLPPGTQYIAPSPPDVSFNVPNPAP